MVLPYKNLFSYFKGGIFMFIVFKVDYFGIENGDLLNRGLDKCVEFIKNHKFKDDKKNLYI